MSKVWGYIREIMVEKKLSVEEIIERCSFRAIGFYEEALVVSLETAKETIKRAREEEREKIIKEKRIVSEVNIKKFNFNEVAEIIECAEREEREKLYKIVEESFNDFDEINRGGINMILRHLKEEFGL